MTSRPKEQYSLIPLTEITSSPLGAGTGIGLFKPFNTSFIKDNGNIFGDPPADVPTMYNDPEAIGFFDSLHDFKSDFIDCQGNIKGDAENYSYKKFGFSFLLNGGYPNLKKPNLIIQDKYSYLNRYTRPLNQDNLENYFALGNIYDVTKNSSKGNMYILPATRSSILTNPQETTRKKLAIYNLLAEIYDRYKDPSFGSKIKLIFDFQLNLFDIIRTSRKQPVQDHFCLLYTAETITDPAPKMKFDGISDVFGHQNFYFENLPDSSFRTFNASSDNVYGNVNVTFSNIQISTPNIITKSTNFNVNTKYEYINSTVGNKEITEQIKMNSKANTIDKIKNIIRNTIERATTQTKALFEKKKFPANDSESRKQFYTDFNGDMNSIQDKQEYQKDYSIYYARKRLGDTLQGRICKVDKLSTLRFNQTINTDGLIRGVERQATKDAVLVTHDRMLFSYAVTQKIPVILDLKDNMILYVPPVTTTGGGQKKIKNIKPKITKNDYPLYKSVKRGGNFFGDKLEIDDAVDSIMNNVDSLIRFLYLKPFSGLRILTNNFQSFLKNVNERLSNGTLKYDYLGQYDTNTLIIAPDTNISTFINQIDTTANTSSDRSLRNIYPSNYKGLKINPTILKIYIDQNKYIEINKYYNTSVKRYYLQTKFKYSTGESIYLIYPGDEFTSPTDATYYFIKNALSDTVIKELTELAENELKSGLAPPTEEEKENTMNDIYENILVELPQQKLSGGGPNIIYILIAIMVAAIIKNFMRQQKTTGGGNGDETNNSPYDKVLNTSFDKLYDTTDLAEKNITSLYFMFSLLRQYELSFVNYQEGINVNYTKINESCILSDLIGATNLIPHNIELYVFLKLLLRDYNEEKLNSINYSLFEYYMYLLSMNGDILYYRFQNLKSYLNVYYTIDVDPTNIPNIIKKIQSQPICYNSWTYFKEIMKETEAIKEQVISENYNAEQNGNYDVIYNNVEKYSLKLAGFTEMKSDFLSKTLNIISSMLTKGSLQKYVDKVKTITGKAQDDVAGVVPKTYKGLEPQPIIQSSFKQPVAVSAGGKRSRRKTRKNKKKFNKRMIHLKTKKINKKKTNKKTRKVN